MPQRPPQEGSGPGSARVGPAVSPCSRCRRCCWPASWSWRREPRHRCCRTGAVTWAFIPVSIGALAGVTERNAGVASGLIDTSQQIGGAIGIAVASTIAAAHSQVLLGQRRTAAAALTGGFHWALWVSGLIGLAAIPVAVLLVRRSEIAQAVAATAGQRPAPAPAPSR